MTAQLQTLSKAALVGTARQNSPLPTMDGMIGQMLQALESQGGPAEAALLRAAGILSICAAAGYEPGTETVTSAVAATETAPLASSPTLLPALADILTDGPQRLQLLGLQQLAASGRVLAHALLPAGLDLGRRLGRLREPLLPVLGRRGNWLAAQNPDWRWAQALPDEDGSWDWETATQEQRLHWMNSNLPGQPVLARQHLQSAFASLPARERLQLLEALAPFVDAEDEAFLSSLLKDRSKEVRQTTARLLSTLPASAFAQTMTSRMAALLGKRRKLLREILEFTPPENFDPDWKNDTIEAEKPAYESLGERAWWAQQLIRLTPLAWWPQHTGLSPAALLDWAKAGDWAQALLGGWLQALDTQHAPDWAEAWLEFTAPKKINVQPYQLLLKLPQDQRERHWLKLLQARQAGEAPSQHLGQLVASITEGSLIRSRALADAVLASLREQTLQRDYQLMQLLPELACVLPDAVLHSARDAALHESLARIASQDSAGRFARIIEQRLTLNAELQDETP